MGHATENPHRRRAIRTALITGASSGLGATLARELASSGTRLALTARRHSQLTALAEELPCPHGDHLVLPADVTEPDQLERVVQTTHHAFAHLDAVVANAGMGIPCHLADLRSDMARQVAEVNYLSVVHLFELSLPLLSERRGGIFAGVSSMAAWRGGPGAAPYVASKAALSAFLESIRPEARELGVTVLEICPGFVKTPMTDRNPFGMPFLMEADDAARRIRKALERRRTRLAFPLPMKLLVGGIRRLPDGLYDRLNRSMLKRLNRRGQHPADAPDPSGGLHSKDPENATPGD